MRLEKYLETNKLFFHNEDLIEYGELMGYVEERTEGGDLNSFDYSSLELFEFSDNNFIGNKIEFTSEDFDCLIREIIDEWLEEDRTRNLPW